jgi:uncharacterized protein (DUF952 family)
MTTILHITHKTDWEQARAEGSYRADTLATEGFIHCSTPEQVIPVANHLFRGQPNLVLLVIDRDKVRAPIRDENLEGGTVLFPHIYGPLNLDAVVDVLDFPPRADGSFELPSKL